MTYLGNLSRSYCWCWEFSQRDNGKTLSQPWWNKSSFRDTAKCKLELPSKWVPKLWDIHEKSMISIPYPQFHPLRLNYKKRSGSLGFVNVYCDTYNDIWYQYILVPLISYSNQASTSWSRRSKLSSFGHCKAPSMINEHSLSPVVEVVFVSGEGNSVKGGGL